MATEPTVLTRSVTAATWDGTPGGAHDVVSFITGHGGAAAYCTESTPQNLPLSAPLVMVLFAEWSVPEGRLHWLGARPGDAVCISTDVFGPLDPFGRGDDYYDEHPQEVPGEPRLVTSCFVLTPEQQQRDGWTAAP